MANEIKPIVPTDISPTDAVVGNFMTDLRQIIVLGNERATYGKQIVATVSRQLQNIYGHKGKERRMRYE